MERKAVSGIMLILLLASLFAISLSIPPVKANGTIYIRADGSIDPPTAPIITLDKITYTLIENITSSEDGIVLERDNIVLDGTGYTVRGPQIDSYKGVDLASRTNVTIQDINIEEFFCGIFLSNSLSNILTRSNITNNNDGIFSAGSSKNNIICENNIANSWGGIFLYYGSDHNSIHGNKITAHGGKSILLYYSFNNTIHGNHIANNGYGIAFHSFSEFNSVYGNNISNNGIGIYLSEASSQNLIYHNNFVNNELQVHPIDNPGINLWDDGYPSGGNYWNDYDGTDYYLGPFQNVTGSDLIGDTPYVIDSNNRDCFPLMLPWTDWYTRYDCIFRVLGYSMAPTLLQNDMIWVHNTTDASEIFAAPYPEGELVVYRNPENLTVYIARRAIAKWYEDETWHFTVKSDGTQTEANITMQYIIGEVVALFRSFYVPLRDRIFTTFIYSNSTLDELALNASGKCLSLNVTGALVQGQTSYCELIIPNILLSGIFDVKIRSQSIPFTKNDYGFYTTVTFETDQTSYIVDLYGAAVGTPPDVAVLNVTAPRTVVCKGYSVSFDVKVENQGDFTETFNITLYADTTAIQTQTVTVSYKNSSTLTFNWNTQEFAKGNYTISAQIAPIQGETDTGDNTLINGWMIVAMIGDITGPDGWPDGKCDIRDIALVAKYFGQNVPPAPANCDLTGPTTGVPDGKIDIRDIATVAKNFGKVDP